MRHHSAETERGRALNRAAVVLSSVMLARLPGRWVERLNAGIGFSRVVRPSCSWSRRTPRRAGGAYPTRRVRPAVELWLRHRTFAERLLYSYTISTRYDEGTPRCLRSSAWRRCMWWPESAGRGRRRAGTPFLREVPHERVSGDGLCDRGVEGESDRVIRVVEDGVIGRAG